MSLTRNYRPHAHESITVDNTVGGVGITATLIPQTMKAVLTLETAQVRYTVDGTAPTTSVGHLLEVGDALELDEQREIVNFKAIRTGSTSGTLKATYYKA